MTGSFAARRYQVLRSRSIFRAASARSKNLTLLVWAQTSHPTVLVRQNRAERPVKVWYADGMDGSCAHRRRNAPYCSCQKLLSRGATQCKLQQSV